MLKFCIPKDNPHDAQNIAEGYNDIVHNKREASNEKNNINYKKNMHW